MWSERLRKNVNGSYCLINTTNNYCDSDNGEIKMGKVNGQKRTLGKEFTSNISSAHAMAGLPKGSFSVAKLSSNTLTNVFQRNVISISAYILLLEFIITATTQASMTSEDRDEVDNESCM